MPIDIFNTRGEKTSKMKLPKEVFCVEASPQLIAQAVRVYLTNQRKAGAKTKTRGEVSGSGKKIWRQKGTGRARHGDRYAPIFVGGGIAHGPEGIVKRLTMPKKMRRRALFGTLSDKIKEKKLLVVEGLNKIKPKTKEMAEIMKRLKLKSKNDKVKFKILLILEKEQKNALRAARNIAEIETAYFNQLNCYQVVNNQLIVFSKEALEHFNQLNK